MALKFAVVRGQLVIGIALAETPGNLPLEPGITYVNVTGLPTQPGIGWTWDGAFFAAPAVPVTTYKHIRTNAFWDRFTQNERLNYEVAAQHDPAATNSAKRDAAKLRLFRNDAAVDGRIRLNSNKTETFVNDLETAGILGAGRAAAILTAPITPDEAA